MSKMNKGLLIGACALAIASTGALVGSYYKEDIKEWWNETFQKEEVKLLSVGDKFTEDTVLEIDMVKLASYIEENYDDVEWKEKVRYEKFLKAFSTADGSGLITLFYGDEECEFNLNVSDGCVNIGDTFGYAISISGTDVNVICDYLSSFGTINYDFGYNSMAYVGDTIDEIIGVQ